jgi:hypothetical protein
MFGLSKVEKRHEVCKNCKCWCVSASGKDGICKARAPITAIMHPTSGELTLIRPSTLPEDYCVHDYVEAKSDKVQ